MGFDVEKIRRDFPMLSQSVYGRPLVYLDSGATAQKPQCVIDTVARMYSAMNSNIHRGIHYFSDQMTALYEDARGRVCRYIGAAAREEVIFTSGATASINLVAYAWCEKFLGAGDNIVVSEIEHHSNIVPWQQAALRKGAELRIVPVDDAGALRLECLDEIIDERTKVVAVTQASNTLGTRPDLRVLIDAAHAVGAVAVVDGCQGVVHGGVDVAALGCDFYCFSGHKLYAPTGIGVLYGRREVLEQMPPFMSGGDMVDKVSFERTTFAPLPLRFEAGTANFVGAVGLGEAIAYLEGLDAEAVVRHERELVERATEQLLAVDGLRIYGTTPDKAPIISFTVDGCDHYDIGMILDKTGVAIRTGHHCAEPVMHRFGVNGMCRASFGLYNTTADVDALVAGVRRAVRMLK